MTAALDVLGAVITLAGAVLMAIAAIGLVRFDAAMVRLHVAAKASSAGVLLVLFGAALQVDELGVALEFVVTGVFIVLSLPLATHALAAARHRQDHPTDVVGSPPSSPVSGAGTDAAD